MEDAAISMTNLFGDIAKELEEQNHHVLNRKVEIIEGSFDPIDVMMEVRLAELERVKAELEEEREQITPDEKIQQIELDKAMVREYISRTNAVVHKAKDLGIPLHNTGFTLEDTVMGKIPTMAELQAVTPELFAKLDPLFVQFLAWQRLLQINEEGGKKDLNGAKGVDSVSSVGYVEREVHRLHEIEENKKKALVSQIARLKEAEKWAVGGQSLRTFLGNIAGTAIEHNLPIPEVSPDFVDANLKEGILKEKILQTVKEGAPKEFLVQRDAPKETSIAKPIKSTSPLLDPLNPKKRGRPSKPKMPNGENNNIEQEPSMLQTATLQTTPLLPQLTPTALSSPPAATTTTATTVATTPIKNPNKQPKLERGGCVAILKWLGRDQDGSSLTGATMVYENEVVDIGKFSGVPGEPVPKVDLAKLEGAKYVSRAHLKIRKLAGNEWEMQILSKNGVKNASEVTIPRDAEAWKPMQPFFVEEEHKFRFFVVSCRFELVEMG